MMRTTTFILCLVALLSLFLSTTYAQDLTAYGIPKEKLLYMKWDMSRESFEIFFERLRELIKIISVVLANGHYLLPHQTGSDLPPDLWILIDISCGGGDESSILLRADNLYQVGFMNKNKDKLFTLGPHGDIIKGSTPSGFGDSYGSLLDDGDVTAIPVGENFALYSCRNISRFDPLSSDPVHVKTSLVQNLLMYSETQRFFPIHDKVSRGWNGASYLDMEEDALLIEWTRISNAIVDWQLFNFWDVSHVQPSVIDRFKVDQGYEVASNVVDVVVRYEIVHL